MNEQELANLTVFITAGAKVISQDKSLQEATAVHSTALQLLEKIKTMVVPEKVGPENPESLG